VARTYIVKQRKTRPFGPFHLEEATLQAVAADGRRSEFQRVSFERGDSVAVLLHDVARGEIILVRQFRYSVLANKNEGSDGWLLELPAGIIDDGEQPDGTARREVEEEIGIALTSLEHIATFFVSPGGTSERILLFYARAGETVGTGGGLANEHEDIEIKRVAVDDFLRQVANNVIRDAKTLLSGYWLRERLNPEK
jgi:ADP-ribose pyrophosphatase